MRGLRIVGFVMLGLVAAGVGGSGAWGQIPISTTTSSSSTTTTSRPPSTTTTAAPAATTTAPRRPTTIAPTTTVPQRTTTTIATPPPAPTTTEPPEPEPKHSGHFSPLLSWLAVLGLVSGFGLFGLQWVLTRPGRQGWTL